MALAAATRLTFSYPGAPPALRDVSLELERGEVVLLLGASGSGKSTLIRAFAGLVPHFHGGRFSGRVEVDGHDTRTTRPAELAGTTATLFQDPEDQAVLSRVANEVAFGLENVGTPPREIAERAQAALAAVGAEHLVDRRVETLSGGELQRVCLASALALEPRLLLLDEPTSQLDPEAAESLVELACRLARERGTTVLLSEQRPRLPLETCDRVLFMADGRIALDAPRDEALDRLPAAYRQHDPEPPEPGPPGETLCLLEGVSFAYGPTTALANAHLELRRGEVVVLTGPNGCGKTTLAKIAAGLYEPAGGTVRRHGRAGYLSQDPGRYLVKERVDEEVALAADLERARAALAKVGLSAYAVRYPRDLSSGERERLALAAVLVTEPDVLVLDEPTRGVDPSRKAELAALLRAEAPRRATLVVTHDRLFAAAVADRIVAMAPERERVYA